MRIPGVLGPVRTERSQGRESNPVRALEQATLAIWSSPLKSGIAAAMAYALMAALFCTNGLGQSRHPYFIYLAESFLSGRLDLLATPAEIDDLTLYLGRYYLYWPPLPAIAFLPLVAAFGSGVSDASLNIIFGGLNVSLVSMLLSTLNERGIARLPAEKRAWLTFFFAFGTVHLTLAPYARVWYTSQVVSVAPLAAAYLLALRAPLRWAPAAAGLMVACAFLTKNTMLFAAAWVPWYLLAVRSKEGGYSVKWIAMTFLVPVAGGLATQAGYNYLRFGNLLETGLTYHLMSEGLKEDYARYGAFNLHYLPQNLFYNFITVPYAWLFRQESHALGFWMGGSLFVMSPPFLLAFAGIARRWSSHGKALAFGCLTGLVPMLFLMGTGCVQFGPRYTLDVVVPLLMATAMGLGSMRTKSLARLVLLSVVMYLPGAILLGIKWAA